MAQYTVRIKDIEDLFDAQAKRLFDAIEEWGADAYIKQSNGLWTVEVNSFTPEEIRLYAYTDWPDPGEMGVLLHKMGIMLGPAERAWRTMGQVMSYHGRGKTRFGTYRHRVQARPATPEALLSDIQTFSRGILEEDRENFKKFLSWAEDNVGSKEWSPRR